RLALDGVQGTLRGPHFRSAVAGVDVEGDAAADVVARGHGPQDLAATGVAQAGADAAVGAGRLVGHEDFQAGAGGVEVAEVERVVVAQAGGVESAAVVVDHRGAEDDFITTVAIHIANAQAVRSL